MLRSGFLLGFTFLLGLELRLFPFSEFGNVLEANNTVFFFFFLKRKFGPTIHICSQTKSDSFPSIEKMIKNK